MIRSLWYRVKWFLLTPSSRSKLQELTDLARNGDGRK